MPETFDRATSELSLRFSIGLLLALPLLGAALQFDLGLLDFGPTYAAYFVGLAGSGVITLSAGIAILTLALRRGRGVGELPTGARIRTGAETLSAVSRAEAFRFILNLLLVAGGGTFIAGSAAGTQLAGLAFVVLLRREEGRHGVRYFESADRNLLGVIRGRSRDDPRIWSAPAGLYET